MAKEPTTPRTQHGDNEIPATQPGDNHSPTQHQQGDGKKPTQKPIFNDWASI